MVMFGLAVGVGALLDVGVGGGAALVVDGRAGELL